MESGYGEQIKKLANEYRAAKRGEMPNAQESDFESEDDSFGDTSDEEADESVSVDWVQQGGFFEEANVDCDIEADTIMKQVSAVKNRETKKNHVITLLYKIENLTGW